MNVDFKEIKDYFYNNRYSNNIARKYAGMFEKVSQVIDEDDILYFYPKYLFVDEQTLQLSKFHNLKTLILLISTITKKDFTPLISNMLSNTKTKNDWGEIT